MENIQHDSIKSHPDACVATPISQLYISSTSVLCTQGPHLQASAVSWWSLSSSLRGTPGPLSGLGQIYLSQMVGGTPSSRGEVTGVPTNFRHQAKLPVGSAGGAPPAGAYPPPLPCAGATLRMYQFPGAHATILLYQRPSKPRARQEDPNQSNICLFFF